MDTAQKALAEFKFAAGNGGDAMTFTGHGAVFGNVDAYGDMIAPGAFSAWLRDVNSGAQPWPAMLSQHGGAGLTVDDMTPVGVWTDISEDSRGLKLTGKLAATPRGAELHTLMKMTPRPAIDGLSIGYIAKTWEPRSKPEDPRRKLTRIDVMEISPVTFPANRQARVTGVKAIERFPSIRDFEVGLRDALGLSAREAKRAASAAWPLLAHRDDADVDADTLAELMRASTACLLA